MTVAVAVKVFDGLVLAADSATTFELTNGSHQVYNNANKIFHLHRRLPIAAMTWGLGNIGSASIATLAKDLRRRLMGQDPRYLDWELDPDAYTIAGVTDRVIEMFHGELYATEFASNPNPPALGLLVAGYGAGEMQAEAKELILTDASTAPTPAVIFAVPQSGWRAFAQPEATLRLFAGIDPDLYEKIENNVDPAAWASLQPIILAAGRSPVVPAMPFADAIELAKFLVGTTAQYSHYLLGPDTVGGVVDVAGINRHEGFRWVNRKHYYPSDLNPWGVDHDH